MFNKINMITSGKLGKEFADYIEREYQEISIKFLPNLENKIHPQYNAMACFSPPSDVDISHIKWIHSFSAGVNTIISHPHLNPQTLITRTVGNMGTKISEYCLCYILADNQNLLLNHKYQKQKKWQRERIKNLNSNSIAILGTGKMGRSIAKKLSIFGCNVFGINRTGKIVPDFQKCYSFTEFSSAPPHIDTLISVLPSTPQTAALLNEKFFRNFESIHFINVGRGNVIDENEIIKLLNKNNIRKATLDVFSSEPLSPESQLWSHNKISITPHQAAITEIEDIVESFPEAYKS